MESMVANILPFSAPSPLTTAEVQACFGGAFAGRRVLVSGHTGFKGSWLCEWLLQLGANVTGFSLPAPTSPALFDQLGLAARMHHVIGDVTDAAVVRELIERVRPDFVFHLAAQALVRRSYSEPADTYAVNVMGTVNVLEALRRAAVPVVAVMVTTDKCYENREWVHSYREEDPLGGFDPYSSSKAAAELVVAAYRRSFFRHGPLAGVKVATARAGNVVGGGDWAADRIVPDCVRSLMRGEPIAVRNKFATRPWQHVLEPLSGYLALAARMARTDNESGGQYTSAYNFGPSLASNCSVTELVQRILKIWPGEWIDASQPGAVHEAKFLNLAIDKAYHELGWRPVWSFDQTIRATIEWYFAVTEDSARALSITQANITEYVRCAQREGISWSTAGAERSVAAECATAAGSF